MYRSGTDLPRKILDLKTSCVLDFCTCMLRRLCLGPSSPLFRIDFAPDRLRYRFGWISSTFKTDYSLRLLLFLATYEGEWIPLAPGSAAAFGISANHLAKVSPVARSPPPSSKWSAAAEVVSASPLRAFRYRSRRSDARNRRLHRFGRVLIAERTPVSSLSSL